MTDSYLLYHDFNNGVPRYFVQVLENGGFNEVLDINFATKFKTSEEAINWSKKNTTFGEYAKADKESFLRIEFNGWLNSGMLRRTFGQLSVFNRPYNEESPEEVLRWRVGCALSSDAEIQYENYKTWPSLYSVFSHLHAVESYWDDSYTNKSLSFKVYTPKNGKLKNFQYELSLILPYCTYKTNDYYSFSIFDHELSENDCRRFLYKSEKDCKIVGRWVEYKKGTLKECFEHMRENFWYE